jgi:hypothetical protein
MYYQYQQFAFQRIHMCECCDFTVTMTVAGSNKRVNFLATNTSLLASYYLASGFTTTPHHSCHY